ALAALIAWRSVQLAPQLPPSVSAVLVTTSGGGSSATQLENSEVSPLGEVTVVVMELPDGGWVASGTSTSTTAFADDVTTVADPRYSPSPWPLWWHSAVR